MDIISWGSILPLTLSYNKTSLRGLPDDWDAALDAFTHSSVRAILPLRPASDLRRSRRQPAKPKYSTVLALHMSRFVGFQS